MMFGRKTDKILEGLQKPIWGSIPGIHLDGMRFIRIMDDGIAKSITCHCFSGQKCKEKYACKEVHLYAVEISREG